MHLVENTNQGGKKGMECRARQGNQHPPHPPISRPHVPQPTKHSFIPSVPFSVRKHVSVSSFNFLPLRPSWLFLHTPSIRLIQVRRITSWNRRGRRRRRRRRRACGSFTEFLAMAPRNLNKLEGRQGCTLGGSFKAGLWDAGVLWRQWGWGWGRRGRRGRRGSRVDLIPTRGGRRVASESRLAQGVVPVGWFAGIEYSVAVESATLGSSRKASGSESWIPL